MRNNEMILSRSATIRLAASQGLCMIPVYGIDDNGHCGCSKGLSCTSPGKHPVEGSWQKTATSNICHLEDIFQSHPDFNLGIATGEISNIFVVDVDAKTSGPSSLKELEEKYGPLPDTPRSNTGGGGQHLFFKYAKDYEIRNRVAVRPGIDIRSNAGFIVAPSSRHSSGRLYSWDIDLHPEKVPFAEPPLWLLNLLAESKQRAAKPQDEWRTIFSSPVYEGSRNSVVTKMVGLLLRRYVDPYVVLNLMLTWNSVWCRPPLEESEVCTIVDSIFTIEFKRRGNGGRNG